MAVGLCWLPLRHPHARPSSSTLPGHDTPNPSTHSQQPDPGCVDHPVAPPLSPEHDGSNWGQDTSQPGALWAGSDRYDNPHCPKCRHDATTCPWVRGPPLELQCFFSCFFGRVQNNKFAPLQGTNTKVEHRPTCHVVTTTVTLAPPKRTHVGPATILWTPDSPPPIEDGSSHSPHAVPVQSPPSPPGAASREVSSGTQRSCCGRVC